ncbi:MAG: MurR/RpiR family transcriptional regulator [Tissierellales bacterium]|nr:MurR/RpiR family transcriptional regulator [Tissierellales bacterium]
MIFEIIKERYSNLSKSHKKIADYLFDNFSEAAFFSINELANKVGVSPSSIFRFSCEIGLEGYPDLQKALQIKLQSDLKPMSQLTYSISNSKAESVLKGTIEDNLHVLHEMYSCNLEEDFEVFTDRILKAKKIFILGLRSSFCAAYYLNFMLAQILDNTTLLELGTGDIFDRVKLISEEDVLVTISYAPYTKETVEILEYAKERNAYTIGITDFFSSPTALRSELTFIAKHSSSTYSFTYVFTLFNAIIISVGKRQRSESLQKLEKNRINLIEKGVYYKDIDKK